ncbi:MAG TPA: cytochrome c biogenesis protein CcdA, partial [Candidatus Limnocylindrales bacterium]|nr:cytochrome c biogenesis protein CcdA [Candidatus Limnocylindrales bacterium]
SRSPLGAFGLGAIFALGWTPCIGPTLGAILGMATLGDTGRSAVLFVAYSAGLGIPFVALALAMDRAPGLIRPLLRHGSKVEFVGGMLVVLIGFAILFDVLTLFARAFSFLWPRV